MKRGSNAAARLLNCETPQSYRYFAQHPATLTVLFFSFSFCTSSPSCLLTLILSCTLMHLMHLSNVVVKRYKSAMLCEQKIELIIFMHFCPLEAPPLWLSYTFYHSFYQLHHTYAALCTLVDADSRQLRPNIYHLKLMDVLLSIIQLSEVWQCRTEPDSQSLWCPVLTTVIMDAVALQDRETPSVDEGLWYVCF